MNAPTPDDVRRALAGLDTPEQKIVAGMLAIMVREPARVRDREWMAERLTSMVMHGAEGFELEDALRLGLAWLPSIDGDEEG